MARKYLLCIGPCQVERHVGPLEARLLLCDAHGCSPTSGWLFNIFQAAEVRIEAQGGGCGADAGGGATAANRPLLVPGLHRRMPLQYLHVRAKRREGMGHAAVSALAPSRVVR
jgi:hypothetical protein